MIQVAELRPGRFERPDPSDRFKQRLEKFNETSLRIRALELGDSGIYGARIILQPAQVEDQSFNLSVYEPVGVPEIQGEVLAQTPHECNVSLRCRAPAGRDVRTAWLPAASGTAPDIRLTAEAGESWLEVRAGAGALNATYTCVARNPVHQRSASVHLRTLCRDDRAVHVRTRWHLCLAFLLAAGAGTAVLAALYLCKKRRKKEVAGGRSCRAAPTQVQGLFPQLEQGQGFGQSQEGGNVGRGTGAAEPASPSSSTACSEEEAPLEPHYAQIQRRDPLAGSEWHPEQRGHVTTVYDQVRVTASSLAKPLA
ncbi:natural killer cell receptor 2B4-like [Apteryx mantelli]|uniref:Natural killer cell receptor 2B4-like n=1 Tax=Apteryx mantelli TaxID=2696672 RepID=A0ABM4FWY7_9AVES